LTPALQAMAATKPDGGSISTVGAELAGLIEPLTIRVAFLPISGSGVTPWRRWVVLDGSYRGQGQASSPGRIGLVAHELTHVLQRELGDTYFWPGGGLRPSRSRRWLGDSTNYMEALAYVVGASVELDLLEAKGMQPNRRLRDDLASLTGEDAANAARYVVKSHPENAVYRKNYRAETQSPDGRIPPGGWSHWLGAIGFGSAAVERIRELAALGSSQVVEPEEVERLFTD